MTVRTKPAPGSAPAHVPAGVEIATDRSAPFSWEDWFGHAGAPQRAAALGLAQQQGLLYPHQLPAVKNGVKPTAVPVKELEPAPAIMRLLAGKTEHIPPLQLVPLHFFDADLDDLQRQAVARALSTPDLFLLHGLPGTGKSRVVAETLLQAARRGWRVLFLAGQTASLDVILERLVGRSEILVLRYLDALEKPESLPAGVRGFTLEEQSRAFLHRVVGGAAGNHEQADSACRQRRDQEPLWAELQASALRCRDLETRLQALQERMAHLAEAVEREAEPALTVPQNDAATEDTQSLACASGSVSRLAELRRARESATRALEADLQTQRAALAKCEQEAAQLAARIAELEPGYRAKKQGRFWTPAFWANLFNGSILADMDGLLEKHTSALAGRQAITQQLDQLIEQQHRAEEQFKQDRRIHLDGEIEARRQTLLGEKQTLEEDARRLDEEWAALCRRLDTSCAARTPAAIAAAQEAWQQKKQHDEQQCQFAHEWTKYVQETGPSLAARLPSFASVTAASILRWHTDAKLREAVAGPFDLVIVEDAEALTEADLLKVSRHGPRCVLVGQALAEPTPLPTVAQKASRALLPAPLVSAVCWGKLWHALGGDTGCWPCSWHREQGRLVCQLMPLPPEDRQYLESEGLADAPDIELRILHRPHTQPCLAQVIFAATCSFGDAFQFMVREVQEFPLEPLGRTGWWSEDAQRHMRHLGSNAPRIHAWIEIESGVRLGTAALENGDATKVACIEFDKAGDWDRAKAEAWLHRHRPAPDHERTVFLQTPYRFGRPLADLVQALVRTGDWVVGQTSLSAGPPEAKPFEFVAVPPFAKHEWPREGAGLELDLSAARHADRLPVGLRQGLPARGYVNYLEAQALMRRLEAWSQSQADAACRVAVLALFEGQVELLRRLIEQSEVLRGRNFPLEVALPSRLHQRECDVVFLSLTRSHAHRCVAFGEDAQELPLALTRPRSRLLVFGDPGTLCKRTTWQGPLETLDAQSAHQELLRISRLLAYLQAQGHALAPANLAANGRE